MSLILKSDQLFFNFFKSEFFSLTRNFHPSNSEIRTYIFPLEIRMKESIQGVQYLLCFIYNYTLRNISH